MAFETRMNRPDSVGAYPNTFETAERMVVGLGSASRLPHACVSSDTFSQSVSVAICMAESKHPGHVTVVAVGARVSLLNSTLRRNWGFDRPEHLCVA